MDRYVVIAKVHRQEQTGGFHDDSSPILNSFFEDAAFTFTGDQSIETIFDRISRIEGDVIEIKLLYDRASYPARGAGQGPLSAA